MSDNIKVVVKVRPLISRELDEKLFHQWRVKNNTIFQVDQNGKDCGNLFTFDKVYDESTNTADVYNDIAKPIVEAATAGFNGTIFAYGQTSSGKTYTMTGTETSPGLIPLSVVNLFDIIKNITDRHFLIRVSYVEIYNESLIDLLNPEKKNIKIQDSLQGVKVDATVRVTTSPEEVLQFMKEGQANRQTGSTNMNEESSRSHSIFQITIESREHTESEEVGCLNVSQLNLVDLAGSERSGQTGATGIRFKEGTHINKSLSSLALVIKQLSEGLSKHVNYRDSKLTRILQNSLGGNAKTSIICAVTPAAVEETISTLQFAYRAKAIKNNPEVNVIATDTKMIDNLTKQLSSLKTQLESKRNVEEDNQKLQKQIMVLQRFLSGFVQRSSVDMIGGNRIKKQEIRRATISTPHLSLKDQTQSAAAPARFCTPSLKYNPITLGRSTEFLPIQSASSLASVPEESPKVVTPPPRITINEEIIELDSDDDSPLDVTTCSPYHKCFKSSKTPPCILRKKAMEAEKDLKEIVELTEREKMYTPNVVELLEKLDSNFAVVAKLEEEIKSFNSLNEKNESKMKMLNDKISENEEVVRNLISAKLELEQRCKDYETKLTDWEVTCDTLKKKSKTREDELLFRLEEYANNKILGMTTITDISRSSISIANSDSNVSTESTKYDGMSQNIQELISDLKEQVNERNKTISELQANLSALNQKNFSLENKTQEFEILMNSCKQQLLNSQEENTLHKTTIQTLNSIIENQKCNLDTATKDIQSYNDMIQELQHKISRKENPLRYSLSDTEVEKLIVIEEKSICNNENISNIIQSLKDTLVTKNNELEVLKSIIQKSERNDDNIALTTELESKTQYITKMQEKVTILTQQLEKNDLEKEKILLEKVEILNSLEDLNNEYLRCTDSKVELEDKINAYKTEIKNTKDFNQELLNNLNENKSLINEITAKNEELMSQLNDNVIKINHLQNDLLLKDAKIDSMNNTTDTTYINMGKEIILKLQNIMSIIAGENVKYTDVPSGSLNVFEILSEKLTALYDNATVVVSQRDTFKLQNVELTTMIMEAGKQFIRGIKKAIDDIDILQKSLRCDRNEDDQNYNLENDNNIMGVKDATSVKDLTSLLNEIDILITHLIKKIANIKLEFTSNIDSLSQLTKAKDLEILELGKNNNYLKTELQKKSNELISTIEENNNAKKESDEIFRNIVLAVFKMAEELSVEDNLTNDYENVNKQTYINNRILPILDKVAFLFLSNNSEHFKNISKKEELLAQAQNKIDYLTEQISISREEQIHFERSNSDISRELQEERDNRKSLILNLKTSSELISDLKGELKIKTDEIDSMKRKLLKCKEQFTELEVSIKTQQNHTQEENLKLKEKYLLNESIQNELACIGKQNRTEKLLKSTQECTTQFPQSLLELSLAKILKSLGDNNNDTFQSVVPTSSNLNINKKSSQCALLTCFQCNKLKTELKLMHDKNVVLTNLTEELQLTNAKLLKEIQDASGEILILLDSTNDLQKRMLSHKTNLSTLTATTYAENKSLTSQVKFLQHHHTRFHTVCQRDLPELKKQLHELMKLMEEENFERKLNTSFKRHSLPDPLENNSILYSFKNESTLDGDLLMLDTNITLVNSLENTLTGHNQTCFEATETCLFNDAACQTTTCYEPVLTYDLTTDSDHVEKTKNQGLNEIAQNLMKVKETNAMLKINVGTSPIKHLLYENNIESNMCTNCKHQIELREKLSQELEEIKLKVTYLVKQKDDIERKFNNLSLEVPSSEVLVRKLRNFEKELENKNSCIEKLLKAQRQTKEELESVQKENDSLSTQIMESISEVDDLKMELDFIKNNSVKTDDKPNLSTISKTEIISQEISKLDKECLECNNKEELIKVLQSKYSNMHSRLNRSYSDSDSSSRYNKICTLQNELDAGREDCNELKEEVTTIKNHLESSNLSISQAMDLDESFSDVNVATGKTNMPQISEEHASDMYTLDKSDCVNYYLEVVGDKKINTNGDIKIIDLMKMFHSKVMTKHDNDIENLVNKLRDYEDSQQKLQEKMDSVTKALEDSNSDIHNIETKFSVLRKNIQLLKKTVESNNSVSTNAVELFKDQVLKVLDSEFSVNSLTIFEYIHKNNSNYLTETMEKYVKLQNHSHKLANELEITNNNLLELKALLHAKETECSLLVAQKAKMQEINDTVTMDLVHKEKELSAAIIEGYRKLVEEKILEIENIDTTLSPIKNLNLLFKRLANHNNPKLIIEKEKQVEALKKVIKELTCTVEHSHKELETQSKQIDNMKDLHEQLKDKEDKIQAQISLIEDLKGIYEKKIDENNVNLSLIQNLTDEVEVLKVVASNKEKVIKDLQEKLNSMEEENENLKHINQILCTEKESVAFELEKAIAEIKKNKLALEKMESDNIILKEAVKENVGVVANLQTEVKILMEQNQHVKEELEQKIKDFSRLESNIKTHETTAKIQTKMISRLQKQREEDVKIITETENQLKDLNHKCTNLQNECIGLKDGIEAFKHENNTLLNLKQTLEDKVSQLKTELETNKPRLSIEAIADSSRRRRQSIHDSKRTFGDKPQDQNKLESLNGSRCKADDIFMDVDDNSSSRSTPVRHSKGRDSLQSKHEESEEDGRSSRCSSVFAIKQRRQSTHDLHRTSLQTTPERHVPDLTHSRSRDEPKRELSNDDNRVRELQERLSSCHQELEELKERYRELDDECETCAEYLRERDEQCGRLKKEKAALEKTVKGLNERQRDHYQKPSKAHAAVNTDEDWANLHSVVVDRMSFDAEVEKNKRLTKIIEELRIKKQELSTVLAKMQRSLEEKSTKESRELDRTKVELRSCKEEIEELRKRNLELDEECETCSQYLKEREEQCRRLKEAITSLEAKVQELQDNQDSNMTAHSLRKKRHTLHDLNRTSNAGLVDVSTQISEEFLSCQVERDNTQLVSDDTNTKQIKRLKMSIEKLSQQNAALEQRLMAATTAPVYVATGSAIVQDQQLTDVMKENRKLKKINAGLIKLCNKREKVMIRSNRENQDPTGEI